MSSETPPQPPKPRAWEVLSEEIEFSTPYITCRRQACRTMRGATVDPYHIFDLPSWSAVVALTPALDVVLVENYRHGSQLVMTEFPGGIIDDTDADPATAAARELAEETGFQADTLFPLPPIHPYPGRFRQRAYPFLGIGAVKVQDQALEDDEDLTVITVPLAETVRLFSDGSRDVAATHGGILLAATHAIMTLDDERLAPAREVLLARR